MFITNESRDPITALDVEGVIADIHDRVWHKFYEEFRIKVKHDEVDWNLYNVPLENAIKYFQKFADDIWKNSFNTIPPMEEGLADKLAKFDYHIVTSRQSLPEIRLWMEYYDFPYKPADEVIYKKGAKAELGYMVYIDDNPDMPGTLGRDQFQILFSQPWNQDVEENWQVKRAKNFDEVLRIVRILCAVNTI